MHIYYTDVVLLPVLFTMSVADFSVRDTLSMLRENA